MKNKRNFQAELENEIKNLNGEKKKLLLHSCCAPCSSYVLEYLSNFFDITILFYNPNIYPSEEFYKRADEQQRLIKLMKLDVKTIVSSFNDVEFYNAVRGLETIKEGGERCFACFKLRLENAARYASENKFDYFCTTLSISPLKNAQKLNEIGAALSNKYNVKYLFSDFKKKNGYKRSIELSAQYNLYRQDYCGCIFSKNERSEFLISRQNAD